MKRLYLDLMRQTLLIQHCAYPIDILIAHQLADMFQLPCQCTHAQLPRLDNRSTCLLCQRDLLQGLRCQIYQLTAEILQGQQLTLDL